MTAHGKSAENLRNVRVLVNRRSGFKWKFEAIQEAFDRHWDTPGRQLTYQFCKNPEDGRDKARRAVEDGCDLLLVLGGDGTVSSIGSSLIGTNAALGAVPMGSGNGFARHFGIPLKPEDAAGSLARGRVKRIDVGTCNDRPFLVSCSMAWDAALVRSFEKSPVRGILPYVFAGTYEFIGYQPQPVTLILDDDEQLHFPDPLVLTVANLTEYGGGTVISASAQPDDGRLELVVARRQDIATLLANIHKLVGGSISELPKVLSRQFRHMTVERERAGPTQADGEVIDAPARLEVAVKPKALNVLIPGAT
ncbi:MAG: diacylglycerol kinase family protein [Candidatus Latescibacterota bacterium]